MAAQPTKHKATYTLLSNKCGGNAPLLDLSVMALGPQAKWHQDKLIVLHAHSQVSAVYCWTTGHSRTASVTVCLHLCSVKRGGYPEGGLLSELPASEK